LITKNENKNQLLPHLSQALGTDFKLSAIRPIKNSLRFEVQLQRMKININILPHLSQALGTDGGHQGATRRTVVGALGSTGEDHDF
jgi:hypothetical protein